MNHFTKCLWRFSVNKVLKTTGFLVFSQNRFTSHPGEFFNRGCLEQSPQYLTLWKILLTQGSGQREQSPAVNLCVRVCVITHLMDGSGPHRLGVGLCTLCLLPRVRRLPRPNMTRMTENLHRYFTKCTKSMLYYISSTQPALLSHFKIQVASILHYISPFDFKLPITDNDVYHIRAAGLIGPFIAFVSVSFYI